MSDTHDLWKGNDGKILFERNNKWALKSISTIKKMVLAKTTPHACYICGKKFNKRLLQLEHKLPATLGGDYKFKESGGKDLGNYKLVCVVCHGEKTGIDKIIINAFKKLAFIESQPASQQFICHITPEQIEILYFYCFRKITEKRSRDVQW